MMRSRVASSLFVDRIRAKLWSKPVEIIHEFKYYYGIDISYYHAWFCKELAKLDVHGDESKSFNELVWYTDAVKGTNSSSLCKLECEAGINRFIRFFVSFGVSIAGFQYCIPFLFINATFLKNKYKGHLLCASRKNRNQGIKAPAVEYFINLFSNASASPFRNSLSYLFPSIFAAYMVSLSNPVELEEVEESLF
ncbi:hypothetical protein L3X38_012687 [Prunus dulcis]|uniref:Uncharacterized protein n=1 Tax=Prunus dulcis TaxID=3755 RepID=A0AAD4WJT3_PRUDU|nr:hypothetical protein L3X38_012687 [Prunus dulcis]